MEYKTVYTKEEMKELAEWFEAHLDKLPKSFQMNDPTHFTDLPKSVHHIIAFLKLGKNDVTFSGQIYNWFILRDKLIEAGY
jgi:hypothetical protein